MFRNSSHPLTNSPTRPQHLQRPVVRNGRVWGSLVGEFICLSHSHPTDRCCLDESNESRKDSECPGKMSAENRMPELTACTLSSCESSSYSDHTQEDHDTKRTGGPNHLWSSRIPGLQKVLQAPQCHSGILPSSLHHLTSSSDAHWATWENAAAAWEGIMRALNIGASPLPQVLHTWSKLGPSTKDQQVQPLVPPLVRCFGSHNTQIRWNKKPLSASEQTHPNSDHTCYSDGGHR